MTFTEDTFSIATALVLGLDGKPFKRSGHFKRAPRGFRRIGSGSYRVAYLHVASNLVCKLEIDNSEASNSMESENAAILADKVFNLPFTLRIPRTVTHRVGGTSVNIQDFAGRASVTYCKVMENWGKVQNPCSCKSNVCFEDVHDKVSKATGLIDIHSENVLINRDTMEFWLIDLGA